VKVRTYHQRNVKFVVAFFVKLKFAIASTYNYYTMVRKGTKFATFQQVAGPLWLKEPFKKDGTAREDALDQTLFSIEGAVYTRWYEGLGGALSDNMASVVQQKMLSLNELFYQKLRKGGDKEENNNFMKNHRRTLVLYAQWCEENYDGDYAVNSAQKAAEFLEARATAVAEAVKNTKGKKVVGEAETMFNAYRNTVAALERVALWQGYSEYAKDLSKHEPILVLGSRLFRERNVERAGPQDYAATSRIMSKRLAPKENQSMLESYWSGDIYQDYKTVTKAHRAQMRDLWFHTAQYEIGRRGQDLRAIRYSMFMLHELEFVKPVKPCYALLASLRHAKEVVNNEELPLAWVRTQDRFNCPVGATAANFVWQNDIVGIGGTSLLKMMKRDLETLDALRDYNLYKPKWRELFFIHDKKANGEISYSTHRKGVVAAFEAGGIEKTAKTQIYRTTRASELIEKGVAFSDVGLFQNWHHDVPADKYLKASVKAGPLLKAAGWDDIESFLCWWEGTEDDIPSELMSLVLPGLDEVADLANRVNSKTRKDVSAVKVCEVLRWLRKVFIEDAAAHIDKYPMFPAYNGHPVFKHTKWQEYVKAERQRIKVRQQQWETSRRDPALAAALKEHLKHKDEAIRDLKNMVRDLIADRKTVPVPAPLVEEEEPPAEMKPERPMPALYEPKSMHDTYDDWVTTQRANFNYYIDAGIPIPWKDLYGDRANTMRQRYHKMKPWLAYMDLIDYEKSTEVIEKFMVIANKYRVDEGVFIKDAFYHLVHPPSSTGTAAPRIAPGTLSLEMKAVGLPIPEAREKRQYKKRKAEMAIDVREEAPKCIWLPCIRLVML
jgi:hypothetical protein